MTQRWIDCDEKASENDDQLQSKLLNHDPSCPLNEVMLLSLDEKGHMVQ